MLKDQFSLMVLHTLYVNGARFPQTLASDHTQEYDYIMKTMREAIQFFAASHEAHSVDKFELLPRDSRTAWTVISLLLRSGLFYT